MSAEKEVTRNLRQQEPGRVESHAVAAVNQIIAQPKAARHNGGTPYTITKPNGGVFVSGRVRWALDELRRAGAVGCTPIHNPAPRWSAYVFNLREMGVPIETVTETHIGDFPGHHARYVLRCGVSLGDKGGAV